MGQGTAGIKGCITIKIKEEDRWDLTIKIKEEDRRADFKKARDGLGVVIRENEAALNTKKRKQVVMHSLLVQKSN